MTALLLILVLVALIIGPQLWIRWVIVRYSANLQDIPGTGAELAHHLLKRFEIDGVEIEETQPHRDHFDFDTPAIRLSPKNYHGRSLTAIAVASHEVGHAIQWHRKEPVFRLRQRYIPLALKLQRAGILMLSISPIIGLLTRSHAGIIFHVAGGALAALCGVATYLIALQEEWDASFNKAMPILIEGNYIDERQHQAVRSVLRAAAFTYAANALASLLQVWRWLPLLLRR